MVASKWLLLAAALLAYIAAASGQACPPGQVRLKNGRCKTCKAGRVKVPDDATTPNARCVLARKACRSSEIARRGRCTPCPSGQVPLNAKRCGACPFGTVKEPVGAVQDAQCRSTTVLTLPSPSPSPNPSPVPGCIGLPRAELCNGIDDNCDGTIDNMGNITCGTGACMRTVPFCINGVVQSCVAGRATTEVCNGIDDNCDGNVDERLGTTQCGLGACRITINNCVNGTSQPCVGNITAFSQEVCNGIDDDCDGLVDDGLVCPSPVPSPSPSATPSPSPSPAASPYPSPAASPLASPAASPLASPVASPVPSPTPSPIASPDPSPLPSPVPSPMPSPLPSPLPSPIPSPEPSPVPSPEPSPVASPTPSPDPSATPSPEHSPAASPEASPSPSPEIGVAGKGAACVPDTEVCDGEDNDCDGLPDNVPDKLCSQPFGGSVSIPGCVNGFENFCRG